jgi:hypothetical protein
MIVTATMGRRLRVLPEAWRAAALGDVADLPVEQEPRRWQSARQWWSLGGFMSLAL